MSIIKIELNLLGKKITITNNKGKSVDYLVVMQENISGIRLKLQELKTKDKPLKYTILNIALNDG